MHQQLPSFQCPPHIMLCSPPQLSYWLSRFVLEVRRQDGEHYPPQTLYSMCCGLLRYVREVKPEINIFKDPQYADFQRRLHAEMKRLTSTGLGVKPKRAEPINMSEGSKPKYLEVTQRNPYLTQWCFAVACTLHCAVGKNTEICSATKSNQSSHLTALLTCCTRRTSQRIAVVE